MACDAETETAVAEGPAFRPLEPGARPGAEAARARHRARPAGRPLPRSPGRSPASSCGESRLRRRLRDGDVRHRLDHRDPAVRPVFHPALARHPRDRERLSVHGAHRRPVRPRVSGRACAGGLDRRPADRGDALRALALRFPALRHRLCPVEGRGSGQAALAGTVSVGDPPERRLDGARRGGRSRSSASAGEALSAPHHARPHAFQPGVALPRRRADRLAVHLRPRRALVSAPRRSSTSG